MKPEVSVFVPFTRAWPLERFFAMFEAIIFPNKSEYELVFYVDTTDPATNLGVTEWATKHESEWGTFKIYYSDNPPPPDVALLQRRNRITNMKNHSREFIGDSDFVFCLEDDTLVPPNAFLKLLYQIKRNSFIGFVEGVEVGRWNIPIIGAWRTDNFYDPNVVQSVSPVHKYGMSEIHGGGFYCYITRTHLYKKHNYYWRGECFSVDMTYGLELCKNGYVNFIDWTIPCAHLLENPWQIDRLIPDENVCGVRFRKVDGQFQRSEIINPDGSEVQWTEENTRALWEKRQKNSLTL